MMLQVIENNEFTDGGSIPQADGSDDVGAESANLPMEPPTEAVRRLQAENAELKDRHLRLAAEFDNFRKRAARERTELGDRAQATLVARLLDVLDDFDRVTAGGVAGASADDLRQVLTLIDKKLRKELEAGGLERIDPAGQPFDPALHEAVSVLVPPAPEQDHLVATTFQAGYRYKGTLIRPARVQVYSSEGHA
jgi:molecular chaperone GrpE